MLHTFIIIVIVVFIAIILGISLIRFKSIFTYGFIFFSGIERLSLSIGFSLTPIVALTLISLPSFISSLRKDTLKKDRIVIFILVSIIVSAFLSIPFSHYSLLAFKSSLYVILYAILLYFTYRLISELKDKKFLYISIFLSVGLFSLYGLIQYVLFSHGLYPDLVHFPFSFNTSLSPLDFIRRVGRYTYLRPNTGFNDVNTSAGFILLYLPFLGYLFYEEIKKGIYLNRSILYIIYMLLQLITILLSLYVFYLMGSRSAYIGLLCVILFFLIVPLLFLMQFKKRIIASIVILVFLIISVTSLSLIPKIQTIEKTYMDSEFSSRAHLVYTQSALREFEHSPLVGGGIGSFYDYFNSEMKQGIVSYYNSVDNPPLLIKYLAEEGIIGLITNTILFIYIFYMGFKQYKKNMLLVASLLAGFLGLFVANLFHAYLPLSFSAVYIGLCLGIFSTL